MSPSQPTPDPWTEVYQVLWSVVLQHHPLSERIRPGNRERLDQPGSYADRLTDGDLPRLRIATEGLGSPVRFTSSTALLERVYRFEIIGGPTPQPPQTWLIGYELLRAFETAQQQDPTLGLSYLAGLSWRSSQEEASPAGQRSGSGMGSGSSSRRPAGTAPLTDRTEWRLAVRLKLPKASLVEPTT
jgi:hypothetical protein